MPPTDNLDQSALEQTLIKRTSIFHQGRLSEFNIRVTFRMTAELIAEDGDAVDSATRCKVFL